MEQLPKRWRFERDLIAANRLAARKGNRVAEGARDPIVYGVAAASNKIAVRTGTRLYIIDGK